MAVFRGFDITSKMLICHSCDNPTCINPDHLFIGTAADNSKDYWEKVRERFPKSGLTEKEAKMIKQLRRRGWPLSDLSEAFKMDHRVISALFKRPSCCPSS